MTGWLSTGLENGLDTSWLATAAETWAAQRRADRRRDADRWALRHATRAAPRLAAPRREAWRRLTAMWRTWGCWPAPCPDQVGGEA